jgi:beta-alanine--pyruvate transaminase
MKKSLEEFLMPFSYNRMFKKEPRMLVSAKGMYYTNSNGNQILDGTAGLWCVNAGHARKEITEAVQKAVAEPNFEPSFQFGHPQAFEFAHKLAKITPADLNHVFYTNSGSEAVDTALKIALAYHYANGEKSRLCFIGRERGYHGVGFGNISVNDITSNRKRFQSRPPFVDHLPHIHNLKDNAFTKGEPSEGAQLADNLINIVKLHGSNNIAAIIVEPVSGSTGVLVPPRGYLKRLRQICDQYGLLLIFDEVITGFGRLGTPFAADYFDVIPDMIVSAKALTNGVIPMGAVFIRDKIYDTLMQNAGSERNVELFHGYTYSGHPLACAAGIGTLEVYKKEKLLTRVTNLRDYWQEAVHHLCGLPHIIDIRNIGLMAGIELESRAGNIGARVWDTFVKCYDRGLMIRVTGETIALSPPLIIEKNEIDQIFDTIANVLKTVK